VLLKKSITMGEKVNLSRIPKFNVGTLVKCKCDDYSKVGVVDGNTGADRCWVKFAPGEVAECPESDVRALTFGEFAWYRDPSTGWPKVGKNKALSVLLSLVMAILFIATAFTVEGPWKLAPMLIGAGIIAINYIGLRYNYIGRWV
jgi:hypothetical protein